MTTITQPTAAKRPTCWEMAMRGARRRVRKRPTNPAASIFVQILGWTIFIASGFVPSLRARLLSPAATVRREPDQPERIDPPSDRRGEQPYCKLMRDLKRPYSRARAHEELRVRLPIEARPWLDVHVRDEEFSPLATVFRAGRSAADVQLEALRAALTWTRQNAPETADSGGECEARPGPMWRP